MHTRTARPSLTESVIRYLETFAKRQEINKPFLWMSESGWYLLRDHLSHLTGSEWEGISAKEVVKRLPNFLRIARRLSFPPTLDRVRVLSELRAFNRIIAQRYRESRMEPARGTPLELSVN